MKISKKAIVVSILFLLSLQFTILGLSSSFHNSPTNTTFTTNLLDVGLVGKDWTLEDILTDTFITFSDFQGKVILLDFFATWCVPCQSSMAEFAILDNSFSNQELVIISISTDSTGEVDLEDFAAIYNMDWKLVIDSANIASHYEVSSIPTIYIFDTDLKINYRTTGVTSAATLTNIINAILDGETPTPTPTPTSRPPREPLDGFWVKNWYWFGILLVFVIIGSVVFIQRRKVIEYNKKVKADKIAEMKRKNQKRRR